MADIYGAELCNRQRKIYLIYFLNNFVLPLSVNKDEMKCEGEEQNSICVNGFSVVKSFKSSY